MKGGIGTLLATAFVAVAFVSLTDAQKREPIEKPGPPKSGFYDFLNAGSEFGIGIGITDVLTCTISSLTQPAIYDDNSLIDCDAEVPHNETTIAVNPLDPSHAVGGYHSYQVSFLGATVIAHIIGTTSATFDGGVSWQQVVPPITPYQFSGDPALAFDGSGRLYFANIADHEGPGGSFVAPSVIVAHSDDGGLTWTTPTTIAVGKGAVAGQNTRLVFQDKEFIAADTSPTSPFLDRVYVTWTSFQEFFRGVRPHAVSPIMISAADRDGTWSAGKTISGSSAHCSAFNSSPNACDANQFSSPAVASSGRVYVGFENFNTPAENQYMVVASNDGGQTWSAPRRAGTIHDITFPLSPFSGRSTLTGCQFRLASPGNIAVDPNDPDTLYAVWADNRNGSVAATNADVILARSADGGLTWSEHLLDGSPNDQFYPWVAVAPSGRVDIGYMDRSYSSGQAECQYGFTLNRVTFDAGGAINSQAAVRVDTGLSDAGRSRWFSGATGGPTTFLGDYNAVAVGSDGATWSLWTDHRNVIPGTPPARSHGQHAVGVRTP